MTEPSHPVLPPSVSGSQLLLRFGKGYALRYVGVYALGLVFLVATNWLTVWIPDLIRQVFDALEANKQVDFVDDIARWIGAASAAVIVVRTLSRVLFFNPGRTIEFRLRNDMLARLLKMSTTFFRQVGVGDLVSRATNDATYVRAFVGFAILNGINLLLAAAMALSQMIETDAWLTLWCVIPLMISTWLLQKGVRWLHRYIRQIQEAVGLLSAHVLESYGGVPVIQAAGAEPAFQRVFDEHNDRYTALMLKVTMVRSFLLPLTQSVGSLCLFLLLWIGGEHVVQGQLTLGQLAAYASYIWILVAALSMTGWLLNSLQRGYVSLQRLWQVLGLEPDRVGGARDFATTQGAVSLELRGVNFRYGDAVEGEANALQDINLTLEPGGILGVYGPVGSGKSTLAMVIAGLLPAAKGQVLIGGIDIKELGAQARCDSVTMIPQESFLFSRTLADNVGYDDPLDAIDQDKVEHAVDRAALADDVQRMPHRLETLVGERGVMLSGGQRQRAQIARALYAGSRLLILDDVLSAVDHDTEVRLLDELKQEMAGGSEQASASAVIVSTRLSALRLCENIVVVDEGKIVEQGSHGELLNRQGLYAAAWAAQAYDGQSAHSDTP